MRRHPNMRVVNFLAFQGEEGGVNGAYEVPVNGIRLTVIASDGLGWDHVSVSLRHRCPTWDEMEHVRKLFFRDDETVMQLHVPESDHVNNHRFCLHMWRPNDGREIPRPESILVGVK